MSEDLNERWEFFPQSDQIIATTFNIDWDVADLLIARGKGDRRNSVLLLDKNQYVKANKSAISKSTGNTYAVEPIGISGRFHPKIVLWAQEGELKIMVGSHNITIGSLNTNLEISGSFDIPITRGNSIILNEIDDFLKGLESILSRDHIKPMIRYPRNRSELRVDGIEDYPGVHFLHSFNRSIIDKVKELGIVPHRTKIICPTHSPDPAFVHDFSKSFGELVFIIDPTSHSIDPDVSEYRRHQCYGIRSGHPLHAKLFVFYCLNQIWMLYGSPNFTISALQLSCEEGGNVEAGILCPVSEIEVDEFLKQLNIEEISWNDLSKPSEPDDSFQDDNQIFSIAWMTNDGNIRIFFEGIGDIDKVVVKILNYDGKILENTTVDIQGSEINLELDICDTIPHHFELCAVVNDDMISKGIINHEFYESDISFSDLSVHQKNLLYSLECEYHHSFFLNYRLVNQIPMVSIDKDGWYRPDEIVKKQKCYMYHHGMDYSKRIDKFIIMLSNVKYKDLKSLDKSKIIKDIGLLLQDAYLLSQLEKPQSSGSVNQTIGTKRPLIDLKRAFEHLPDFFTFNSNEYDFLIEEFGKRCIKTRILFCYWAYRDIYRSSNPTIDFLKRIDYQNVIKEYHAMISIEYIYNSDEKTNKVQDTVDEYKSISSDHLKANMPSIDTILWTLNKEIDKINYSNRM